MRLIAAALLFVATSAGAIREQVGPEGKPEACFSNEEMQQIVDEYGGAVKAANRLLVENAELKREVEKLRSTLSTRASYLR